MKEEYILPAQEGRYTERRRSLSTLASVVLLALLASSLLFVTPSFTLEKSGKSAETALVRDTARFQEAKSKCDAIRAPVGPPSGFSKRTRSDRAIENSPAVRIENVKLWTGEPTEGDDFGEVLDGVDVLVKDGIIHSITKTGGASQGSKVKEINTKHIDGKGRWMSPGIIDVHVHAGLGILPDLRSNNDVNSLKSTTTPGLRSIDALSAQDWSFASIASGGVTTGLALPGSANNVGGQAFPMKFGRLGQNAARSGAWSRVVDPPTSLTLPGEALFAEEGRNGLYAPETGMQREDGSSSWRHMKMACGENPRRVYKQTRMDEALAWRQLFERATALKQKQDEFCGSLGNVKSDADAAFPDELDLEAVVALLRGKVKLNTHCYTVADLTSFVAHTNEFKFHLTAFHHAHETYLVPDLLRKAYGGPPAVALFSLNADYKMESYFGSPFAPAILAQENFTVNIKSDHPVTDSRRVLTQAAQAHHFGLSAGKALRAVTSNAAKTLGLEHRIGQAKEGFDADLVLWDRHPLALGASPVEVIIDGIVQKKNIGHDTLSESRSDTMEQTTPKQADFTEEIKRVARSRPEIIAWEEAAYPVVKSTVESVSFSNVSQVYSISGERGSRKISSQDASALDPLSVLVADGQVVCVTSGHDACPGLASAKRHINLRGGTLIPGAVAFGSPLGSADILPEPSAIDGFSSGNFDDKTMMPRAVDGLRFGGNDLRRAHASGVRTVVTHPLSDGTGPVQGVAVQFDAGATSIFDKGAIRKSEVAMHVTIDHWQASDDSALTIGQQIATLRRSLLEPPKDAVSDEWARVSNGSLPLIVEVAKAETIEQLILIKMQHDAKFGSKLKLVLSSADEASYGKIPEKLAENDIAVLTAPFAWPRIFDAKRGVVIDGYYAGSKHSSLLQKLKQAGVRVGMSLEESWQAMTVLWDTIQAGEQAGLSRHESLALMSSEIMDILDLDSEQEMVAYDGDPFQYGARVVAISTPNGVDLMD